MRMLRLAALAALLSLSAAPLATACSGSFMPSDLKHAPEETVTPASEEGPANQTLVLGATGGGALLLTGAAVLALRKTAVA